jgi:uncharacterized protein (TIGR00369 family)
MSPTNDLDLTSVPGLERALLIAPFHRWLGLRVAVVGPQGIEIVMPWREELVSNPAVRATHGGVLASLIDLTGLYTVLAAGGSATATADLRVDYHRTAKPGELRALGRVVKLGRRLSVADTELLDAEDVLVASGRGAYLGG